MHSELLIPKSRIAPLIGKKGAGRKLIERAGRIKLWIDSGEGTVKIISKEPATLWIAEKAIDAVGRGFSPMNAVLLFQDDYALEKIDLRDFKASSKSRQQVMRGRIIGTEGKVKKIIQKYTNARIAVQGKTISIIGKAEDVIAARRAVERILSGSRQGTAFGYLRKKYEP